MRSPTRLAAALLCLAAAACTPTDEPAGSTPATTPPAPAAQVDATASASPAAPAAETAPVLSGDAATNPACELASAAEIRQAVGANVVEIRGSTGPGAYAETMLSCTWFLDSTDIGIPSVSLQWEFPVTHWHDPVYNLYEDIVAQGLAEPVPDVGETAILQGATAETLAVDRIVRLTVLMHASATPEDQANAVELLRLVLSRT